MKIGSSFQDLDHERLSIAMSQVNCLELKAIVSTMSTLGIKDPSCTYRVTRSNIGIVVEVQLQPPKVLL